MKKIIALLALFIVLQIGSLCTFQASSAATTNLLHLPSGASGILPANKVSLTTPQPNLKKRQHQWQFSNPKLDSRLNYKIEKILLNNLENPQTPVNPRYSRKNRLNETTCVQVKCAAIHRDMVEKKISGLNGIVTGHNLKQTTIQALIPLSSLNSLAMIQEVHFIKTPSRAITFAGNYVTEALDDINANNWHNAGFYGQGTRIGVIDVGFKNYKSLLGNDLPATVSAKNFVDGETQEQLGNNNDSPHGTACAEVIHDVAPQATIYLAKIYTDIDLQQAVTWLKTYNIDIISTSLGWYNLTPGDGTGGLANIVTSAYNDGILWVTAAGNDQQRHWGGLFSDPDNNGMHNFDTNQEINFFGPGDNSAYLIDSGFTYTVFARWSDWQNVDQDYDIYVYRWDIDSNNGWEKIAWSINNQDGSYGQTPTEAARFTTSGSPTAYGFIVYRNFETAQTVNFEIFVPYAPRLDEILTSRSLPNLADAARATTVSAIDANSYIRPDYSSEGPTNGSGGSASGGLNKPDITAYTNVSSTSYGPRGFSGTSAATPHVAGTAALILSDNPGFSPGQLQSSLENQAIDIGTSGFDHATGWGRLHLNDQGGLPSDNATWKGYSTSWNSTGNWSSNMVPGNTNVTIPSSPLGGYWPLISGTAARANKLTLSGQLIINYGSLTISD